MEYWSRQPRLHQKLLEGTSQGSKNDLPPREWIREELKRFGVIDAEGTWSADLQGSIHPLYARERWLDVEEERYAALQQSFLLSTKLLEVAGPWLCNFLPPQNFDCYLEEENRYLPIAEDYDTEMVIRAMAELVRMSERMQWDEDPDMWQDKYQIGLQMTGLTHLKLDDPGLGYDYNIEQPEEWYDEDERAERAGDKYRQITITIASQYVDAILESAEDSEQRMIAVFMAAITMTHEVAHLIFFSCVGREIEYFWVGNDVRAETGFSLIAWLFDGWFPDVNHLGNDEDFYAFKSGLHWSKMFRRPIEHPRAQVFYSMPLSHVQRILSQKEWSKFGDLCADSLAVRQGLLHPETPFKNGRHARRGYLIRKDRWNFNMEFSGFQTLDEDDTEDEDINPERAHIDEDWDDTNESVQNPKEGSHQGGKDKGGNGQGGNGPNSGKPPTGGTGPSQSLKGGTKRKRLNDLTNAYPGGDKNPKGLSQSEKLLKKEALLAQLDIELNAERQRGTQARKVSAPGSDGMTEARRALLEARHEEVTKAHNHLAGLSRVVGDCAMQAETLATTATGPAPFTYAPYTNVQQSLLELSVLFIQTVAQLVEAAHYHTPSWTLDQRCQNADARVTAETQIERTFNDLQARLLLLVREARDAIGRDAKGETRPAPTYLERHWHECMRCALGIAKHTFEQHNSFQEVAIQDRAAARTPKA